MKAKRLLAEGLDVLALSRRRTGNVTRAFEKAVGLRFGMSEEDVREEHEEEWQAAADLAEEKTSLPAHQRTQEQVAEAFPPGWKRRNPLWGWWKYRKFR